MVFEKKGDKLEYWYGPKEDDHYLGALLGATSEVTFQVTWQKQGEFSFTASIMAEDNNGDFTIELDTFTGTIEVKNP